MAIYHFSAKVISRGAGSSALAAAAYRSASRLYDERLDRAHDFSNKAGVIHSEVLLPDGAPEAWRDRATLWNAVEAAEVRKDAQLAREVEFAIPRELDQAEGVRLARDFVSREFVAKGMVADLNVHWDVGEDWLAKPHAHVMLSMREAREDGFGAKIRNWNQTELLEHWREAWAEHVNQRLAELDIDVRVDHRSFEAQGIGLEPQHKIGPAAARMAGQGLASERIDEHHAIARANGDKILADPGIALDAITRTQATFTTRDLAMFVHRHSEDKEQFDHVLAAVKSSPELIRLGRDGRGDERFTSRDMLASEQRLEQVTERLANRQHHFVPTYERSAAFSRAASADLVLSHEQDAAFEHVTGGKDLSVVVGYAGTGKSAMLGVARDAWEHAGYRVQGAALSGIAAENLEQGSGIASRTLASLEHRWSKGDELLTSRDVLVIDEAGMIGTRQMERVLAEAEKRGAKVVLVGDPEQLQAIEAGAAFRSIAERHGAAEIMEVRRQRDDWQRDATRQLATERTGEAIAAYADHGHVHVAETRDDARVELIERWDRQRLEDPHANRLILTHTNDEVHALNLAARERLRTAGELGQDVTITTERGTRDFAVGDRVMFLRNERGLGVKNGSLGTVESVSTARMAVMLDSSRSVAFDVKDYSQLDHGYAATIHKSQGVTIDQVHVLATPGLDRHAAYVALSRHREQVELHYGRDDFADQAKLVRTLSRERGKDMAADYTIEPDASSWRALAGIKPRDLVAPELRRTEPAVGVRSRDLSSLSTLEDRLRQRVPAPTASLGGMLDLSVAVQRVAKATAEVQRVRAAGRTVLPHQQVALDKAYASLDAVRPRASRDLQAALERDPPLASEASQGRVQGAIRAMQLEAELRVDPQKRADTFVQRWQALDRQRRLLLRDHEDTRAGKLADTMIGMAKGLEREPQVESLLRGRKVALGLDIASDRSIGQSLADMMVRGRSRGIGIGM